MIDDTTISIAFGAPGENLYIWIEGKDHEFSASKEMTPLGLANWCRSTLQELRNRKLIEE